VLGDRRRQSHERVVITNINAIDFATVQVTFMCQSAHDIARLHSVPTPHFQSKKRLWPLRPARSRGLALDRLAPLGDEFAIAITGNLARHLNFTGNPPTELGE